MQISELLSMNREGLIEHGPIVIAALGDSVTHGMFDRDCADHESVYHNRLRQMLNAYKPYVPVCVINAGIGGTTAKQALARLDRDVLSHRPDLVTVCFGLNDVNYPLDEYITSMREILVRSLAVTENVIVVTPNMLNTYVAEDTEEKYAAYAAVTAEEISETARTIFIPSNMMIALKGDRRRLPQSIQDPYPDAERGRRLRRPAGNQPGYFLLIAKCLQM